MIGTGFIKWKNRDFFDFPEDVIVLPNLTVLVNDVLVFEERNRAWNMKMLFE